MLGRPQGPLLPTPTRDNPLMFMVTLCLTITTVIVLGLLLPAVPYHRASGMATFLLVALIVSLNLEQPDRTITPGGYLVCMLVYLAFAGVALLAIIAGDSLLLLVTPWIVVLLSLLCARGGRLRFSRRLLLGSGIVLFLMLLAIADLQGLWWQPLLLSLAACLPVLLAVGWRYRRNRRQGAAISSLVAGLAGFLSCSLMAVGVGQDRQVERGMMATFLAILITALGNLMQSLRGRVLIWSCVLLLLLGASYLFAAHTLLNTWLALGSGLLLLGALLGGWRLEISRPRLIYRPLPAADLDADDEELFFLEEEMPVDEPEES
jgi:hypothetical protein